MFFSSILKGVKNNNTTTNQNHPNDPTKPNKNPPTKKPTQNQTAENQQQTPKNPQFIHFNLSIVIKPQTTQAIFFN